MKKPNKFDSLNRDDLLRMCLEQEDELEKLRPKPARFKLGQLVAVQDKVPFTIKGQPALYFTILSVEFRNNTWHYGYTTKGPLPAGYSQPSTGSNFATFPEKMLRAISEQELTGSGQPNAQPVATEASTAAQLINGGGPLNIPAQPGAFVPGTNILIPNIQYEDL